MITQITMINPRRPYTIQVLLWDKKRQRNTWQTVETTDRQGDAFLFRDWLRDQDFDNVADIYKSELYKKLFG